MVEAATEFRKNSFNDSDSAILAKVATTFQNVSDEAISAGDSASFIIAQMKAFGIEAGNAEHIIDAVNDVSNKYAVSSGQLAKNLGNMSSALAVGNNSFEESLGLLTAGVEVTRNASKVSRALVSVQSRLNQVIDESSSTGQALTDWYKKHNIAILDQQDQLRSLYDVLTDVAKIWPELTKNEQAYYLNQQAGANQSQNLAAILSNFDTAAKATTTAVNSAGSAMRENEAYAESLDFQTNVLKADFQDLANNVIDKQLISALLTLGDAFLKVANTGLGTFITKVGLLAGTGWGLSNLLKVTNIIPVITSQFSNLATVIGMIGNPAVVSSIGGIGTALSTVGGFAGIALPALLAISAALVGIITLVNALEENAHKAEKQLQDLRTQIDEMEDPASEYSNLKSRVDELTESEKIRLGVLQSQLDTLKEQEESLSRQQLAKWQKGQVEDQTTYVTNYDDYGYGVTEAYTYNQAADSLNNFREAYLNLERDKKNGQISNSEYVSSLQALIDKNQTTITNLRDLKTAYEETGDATYKLNEDQERFLLWADAASEKLATNATNVANAVQAEQDAADGLEDAMSQIEVATYDTSTASAKLTASLFDQNGQLTTAAQTALSVDGSMVSLAQSELQAQQAAAQANYANLILEIEKVGSAAMITAGQLSQMMALAGVSFGTADSDTFLKMRYRQTAGETAEANPEGYNKFVTDYLSKRAKANYEKTMKETQEKLDQLQKNFPSGGGGGGSSRKSAEEKATEEAEKQAKKAQKAQEKAAKESQEAYESTAKSAEQAAQEAARAAEQAAEEAKQKILDSIQELKDASDDFWDSKTDAIEETNKELDRQKQLEEKLKALEEAKQKKILLYKNGQFQYDKDYGTIAKAQADYEETRDKIQRERELEQLQEMKDNATEIFNEMKDIISNGGDVTQTMINNWLSQMQADGANYYDSNKAILSDWLTWAQGAIKEFSQSALESFGNMMTVGGSSPSGQFGNVAGAQTNGQRYLSDPFYYDENGDFVGYSVAMWMDIFEAQLKNAANNFKPLEWLGGQPGTNVFDDWAEVLDYWGTRRSDITGQPTEPAGMEDMLQRLQAAQKVLEKYRDVFESLGYEDYLKVIDKTLGVDRDELYKQARMAGATAHPEDPFGWRNISPADWTTTAGKLYDILQDITTYEYYTGSQSAANPEQRGTDYTKMTIAGDLYRTAAIGNYHKSSEKKFTDAWGDYFPGVNDIAFDPDKLERFRESNEEVIKWLSKVAYFDAQTDEERAFIHQEAEARRQARDYAEEILYGEASGKSEAERAANRQAGGTVEARRQEKKNSKNIESIEDTLQRVSEGQAISDEYINSARDYIVNALKENREISDKLYSDTEKAKIDAQTSQMKDILDQLNEIQKYEETTTSLLEGEETPWAEDEMLTGEKDTDWLRDEEFDKDAEALRAQMLENAESWWKTTDEAERKRLHEENVKLAEQIGGLTYTGSTGKWSHNATGTHNFRGGLSIVGENGPELRVLKRGDNIIPADKTENLWKWASLTPNSMLAAIGNHSTKAGDVSYGFNISNLQLPNVTDAKSLVQGLKNYALQYSYKR